MGEIIVKRPVQFNITNHINKCMEEVLQQQSWIDQGGLYYAKTVEMFKERAAELQKIADAYIAMYKHFTDLSINDETVSTEEEVKSEEAVQNNVILSEQELSEVAAEPSEELSVAQDVVEQVVRESESDANMYHTNYADYGLDLIDVVHEDKDYIYALDSRDILSYAVKNPEPVFKIKKRTPQQLAKIAKLQRMPDYYNIQPYIDLNLHSSLELIELLRQGKIIDHTDKRNVEMARIIKRKLGEQVDNISATFGNESDANVINSIIFEITNWFRQRFDYPHDILRKYPLKYNFVNFNRSLDALIIAFAVAAFPYETKFSPNSLHKFINELHAWLENEGSSHRKGEPDPYLAEYHGLVSHDIVKYMDGGFFDPIKQLKANHREIVVHFACVIENLVKPLLYPYSDYMDTSLYDANVSSIKRRANREYDICASNENLLKYDFISLQMK